MSYKFIKMIMTCYYKMKACCYLQFSFPMLFSVPKHKWRFCLDYQDVATLPIFTLLGNTWHKGFAQGCLKMKENSQILWLIQMYHSLFMHSFIHPCQPSWVCKIYFSPSMIHSLPLVADCISQGLLQYKHLSPTVTQTQNWHVLNFTYL